MCLPNTSEQAGINKSLQRAINAAYASLGLQKSVTVDARIGTSTLLAAQELAPQAGLAKPASVEELVSRASRYAEHFAIISNTEVNADPDPKPAEPPGIVPADVEQTRQQHDMPSIDKGLHWGWYVAGTVALGLATVGTAVWYKKRKAQKRFRRR
jgi:lysozyme family protein